MKRADKLRCYTLAEHYIDKQVIDTESDFIFLLWREKIERFERFLSDFQKRLAKICDYGVMAIAEIVGIRGVSRIGEPGKRSHFRTNCVHIVAGRFPFGWVVVSGDHRVAVHFEIVNKLAAGRR